MALSVAPTTKQAAGEHLSRRTFAIISHPDAGKTTLSEKLLLAGGAIHLAGEVKARGERRRARSDWMKIEQARGISVTTSVMTFDHGDLRLNLLDTPGHDDFSEDTYRTLTAVDCAIMVIDAAKGIEAQTRKLFEVCRLRDVPIITFVNKIDREGRDPFELMDEIADQLALDTSPVTWPIGMGLDFRGVYHLIDDRVALGSGEAPGGLEEARVKAALPAAALDRLAEEAALAREACPVFDLESFRAGHLTPVFFGSALRNFGIDHLLDGLARCAPPPVPRPTVSRAVAPEESPLTGFVFKVQANMDPNHRDRVAFVRLCSGRFTRGMKLSHVRSGKTMAIYNPIFFFARERALTEAAVAGDIIGVPNHGSLRVGDTLTEGEALRFTGIPNFAPEILRRVRLGDPMKAKHLKRALEDLAEEGVAHVFRPLIGADWIVGVVGPLQLDVLAERIGADYNVDVDFEAAPYETARWVEAPDDATEKRFIDANRGAIATDRDGQPVFLARNAWALGRAQEDWPDVNLAATRERH